MSKVNVRREDKGDGADYINHQRAVDGAMVNKVKSQKGENADINRQKNRDPDDHERDVSEKRSGSRK
jgi:hypothetical protein